jgi:hypothetical protein
LLGAGALGLAAFALRAVTLRLGEDALAAAVAVAVGLNPARQEAIERPGLVALAAGFHSVVGVRHGLLLLG